MKSGKLVSFATIININSIEFLVIKKTCALETRLLLDLKSLPQTITSQTGELDLILSGYNKYKFPLIF